MVNANLIFGGIEGGGTHSWVVLVDGMGNKLAELEGPSTNHWLSGMAECQNRVYQLVIDAKKMAGISEDVRLEGLVSTLNCQFLSSIKFSFIHICLIYFPHLINKFVCLYIPLFVFVYFHLYESIKKYKRHD
ncbi:N-acetylglucosamine kinase [Oratosquilla oratoria]|uniref:N-acetylglucosamine kinase n=1 Tax=Oratosquilla oratoria TaxID=337810 RepID=UPI003F759948